MSTKKSTKLCLVNLPQCNALDDKLDPPLGLMYMAAVARRNDMEVRIVDLPFVKREDWQDAIGYADYYGITVYSASLYHCRDVIKIMRANNPACKVVAGGPHPTSLPGMTLNEGFDLVVRKEGESVIPFLDMIKGRIVTGSQLCFLDELPMPARDLVDIHAYTRTVAGKKATSVVTSRGCPFNCAFCCKDVFGSKVRLFSIERVVKEIKSIIKNYGIGAFIFYDDTLTLNKKRLKELCEALKPLDIVFRCNGNARTKCDYQLLYEAGCREICFGIESGSQEILNFINKQVTVEQNRIAIRDAQRAGILVKAFLMIGNPGESVYTVEQTKKFINEADPDQFTLFTFVPLPGCDIWKNPEKYGVKIIDRDFRKYYNIAGDNDGGIVIENTDLKALREDLVGFLRKRGQRGILQDYYKRQGSMAPQPQEVLNG